MIFYIKTFAFLAILNSFTLLPISKNRNAYKNNYDYLMEKTSNTDSLLLAKIRKIDKRKFIDNSVGIFLQNKTIANYSRYSFIDEPPRFLGYLSLKYSKKVYIEIVVKKYTHINRYDEKRDWKLAAFKKEKISEIRVMFEDNPIEIINSISK
jgi:hypothetical protein